MYEEMGDCMRTTNSTSHGYNTQLCVLFEHW